MKVAVFFVLFAITAGATTPSPVLDLDLVDYIQLRADGTSTEFASDLKSIGSAIKETDPTETDELKDLRDRKKLVAWMQSHRPKGSDPCEVAVKTFSTKALPEELLPVCEGYDPTIANVNHGLAIASLESFEDLTLDRAKEAALNAACAFEAAPSQSPFETSHVRENWRWAVGLPLDQIRFSSAHFEKIEVTNSFCELYGFEKSLELHPELKSSPWAQKRCEKSRGLWTKARTAASAWTRSQDFLTLGESKRSQCRDEKMTIADYFACSFESYKKILTRSDLQTRAARGLQNVCRAQKSAL